MTHTRTENSKKCLELPRLGKLNFINSGVLLKVDDIMGPERPTRPKAGVVIGRSKDEQGRPIGTAHDNPYLSSAIYDVLDDDGVIHRLLANQVAENLWSQLDNDGHEIKHAHEICGHKKNGHAVEIDNGYKIDKRGNKVPKTTILTWIDVSLAYILSFNEPLSYPYWGKTVLGPVDTAVNIVQLLAECS